MRRLLMILLFAACLLPEGGQVRAQATADQLNRLSLEALTTPAPGGNPGPRSSSYRRGGSSRSSYGYDRASQGRGGRQGYRRSRRSYGRSYGNSERGGGQHYSGRRSRGYGGHRYAHHSHRSRGRR